MGDEREIDLPGTRVVPLLFSRCSRVALIRALASQRLKLVPGRNRTSTGASPHHAADTPWMPLPWWLVHLLHPTRLSHSAYLRRWIKFQPGQRVSVDVFLSALFTSAGVIRSQPSDC
jgi:hypothetical protein